jgi:predicted GIY-YIG superfamily endonuclease
MRFSSTSLRQGYGWCAPKRILTKEELRRRASLKYVYLLQSLSQPGQRYIGFTGNLKQRLQEHNQGKSPHTSKFAPGELVIAIAFRDHKAASAFESDLKSGSGKAFAKRHFWQEKSTWPQN